MEQSSHAAPASVSVVIVGAGPTGLSLAAQLVRYGVDFMLLEKNAHTTPLSKAMVVQARSLEIFLELGLAEQAIQRGRKTTALNMFYKGERRVSVDFSGLGEGLSPFPFALSLEQCKTEELLAEYLKDHGRTIHWQTELTGFEQDPEGVTVHYQDPAGQAQTVRAAYLVGCDGAGSHVRQQLGLSFEGDTVPKLFYVADVVLNSSVIRKDELYIFLIRKGFTIFFPMEGAGHYRMIGILPGAGEAHADVPFEEVASFVQAHIGTPVTFDDCRWFSTYKVHSRMAGSFGVGRCFLAGDAAHIHTPAGGQGMNTGIQDAYNLAWKLAFTLRGALRPEVLASYNQERMENARRLLATTDRMFDLMAGTSGVRNFIRLHVLPYIAPLAIKSSLVKGRLFPMLSQTGIAYPDSPLTVTSAFGTVRAGDRMPYFQLPDGSHVFDHIAQPQFKLLYFGEEDLTAYPQLQVDGKVIPTIQFREVPPGLFGSGQDFWILLRPDNHIVWIGKDYLKCLEALRRMVVVRQVEVNPVTPLGRGLPR